MQIKFFDDNIFCELKPVAGQDAGRCELCGMIYKLSKQEDIQEIKIPCYRKIQNNIQIQIDPHYQPEPIHAQHKPPSLIVKIRNFVTALYRHIISGAKRTSADERNKRYAICQGCEFFDGSACTQCGCPISRHARFISKLDWSDQHCPIGKW